MALHRGHRLQSFRHARKQALRLLLPRKNGVLSLQSRMRADERRFSVLSSCVFLQIYVSFFVLSWMWQNISRLHTNLDRNLGTVRYSYKWPNDRYIYVRSDIWGARTPCRKPFPSDSVGEGRSDPVGPTINTILLAKLNCASSSLIISAWSIVYGTGLFTLGSIIIRL